jgi:hypothetical protein
MKINEFNDKKRIDELDLGNLMNKLRGRPTITPADKRAKDIFIKGFLSKVVGGLDSAIKSTLVSTTATAPATAPATASPAPGANAFGQMTTQLQPKAAPKTSSTGGTTQQTPTGQTQTAKAAPIKPVPSPGTNAFGQMTTQLQPKNKAPLPIKSSTGGNIQKTRTGLKHTFEDDQYSKLNAIFEGIISLDEAPTQQSISQYVMNFTNKYLGDNPNFKPYQANIQQLAQRVEKEYSRDRGNKALTDLANLVYSMAQTVPRDSTSSNTTSTVTNQPQAQTPQALQANQTLKNLLANATVQQKAQIIQFLNKANNP